MKILMVGDTKHSSWNDFQLQIKKAGYPVVLTRDFKAINTILGHDNRVEIIIAHFESLEIEKLKEFGISRGNADTIPIIIAAENIEPATLKQLLNLGVSYIIILPAAEETLKAKLLKLEYYIHPAILVIDDEPEVTTYIKELLEMENFKVEVSLSAEEGLKIIQNRRLHAIISDIQLPGMNGIEFLIKVKNDFPNLPVILITGYSKKIGHREAMANGADGFFEKPFHNVELVYTLRTILASNTTMLAC